MTARPPSWQWTRQSDRSASATILQVYQLVPRKQVISSRSVKSSAAPIAHCRTYTCLVQARIVQIESLEFRLWPACRSVCQLHHAKGKGKRDFTMVYKGTPNAPDTTESAAERPTAKTATFEEPVDDLPPPATRPALQR